MSAPFFWKERDKTVNKIIVHFRPFFAQFCPPNSSICQVTNPTKHMYHHTPSKKRYYSEEHDVHTLMITIAITLMSELDRDDEALKETILIQIVDITGA